MLGMARITLYLPDDLKASLEWLAEEDGRSEGDIIRKAIRTMLAKRRSARPRVPLSEKGLGDPGIAERVGGHLEGFGER